MALAHNTRPAPFGAIAAFHIISRIEAALNKLVDWNAKRSTERTLSALSDRELEDIGLSRGDIHNLPVRF